LRVSTNVPPEGGEELLRLNAESIRLADITLADQPATIPSPPPITPSPLAEEKENNPPTPQTPQTPKRAAATAALSPPPRPKRAKMPRLPLADITSKEVSTHYIR
jgi:hypothetical protein